MSCPSQGPATGGSQAQGLAATGEGYGEGRWRLASEMDERSIQHRSAAGGCVSAVGSEPARSGGERRAKRARLPTAHAPRRRPKGRMDGRNPPSRPAGGEGTETGREASRRLRTRCREHLGARAGQEPREAGGSRARDRSSPTDGEASHRTTEKDATAADVGDEMAGARRRVV